MKIVQYIYELIQKNGSIIIPDFGTFILKDTSTRIDNNKKIILPPSNVLTFDENIKNNNNILTDYIAKIEAITKEKAAEAIIKFVEQLRTLLNSGKTVEFRNIGKLHLNHKKQIVYDYDSKAEYVSESFGLTPVKFKTFTKPKEVKQISLKEKPPKVKKPRKKFPKAAIWLIIVFVPIATAAVLAFLYPDMTKEIFFNSKEYISGLFKKSEPDKNIITIANTKDSLKDTLQVKVVDTVNNRPKIGNNNRNANNTNNEVKPTLDDSKKFHVIVGCFQSKSNAEKYFKTIEGKGYTSRLFEAGSDGLYKVSCGSYSTREEANQELKKVYRDLGPQGWILKK